MDGNYCYACVTEVTDNEYNIHGNGKSKLVFPLSELPRTLDINNSPKLCYRRRQGENKTTVHWGQRKLILSEIEFLTKYAGIEQHALNTNNNVNIVCIYAGAAPGTHISLICCLFPYIKFVLVDPCEFDSNLYAHGSNERTPRYDNIDIINEYMSKEIIASVIKKYKLNESEKDCGNFRLLYISDVRSTDYRVLSYVENEKGIQEDMKLQMEWYFVLKPHASMLKFRLPWSDTQSAVPVPVSDAPGDISDRVGITTYLDGDLYYPVFGPQTTTECRLVVDASVHKHGLKMYSHKDYMNAMFYFNNVTRYGLFSSNSGTCDQSTHCELPYHDCMSTSRSVSKMVGSPYSALDISFMKKLGLDNCYDCSVEMKIVSAYITMMEHASIEFKFVGTGVEGNWTNIRDFIVNCSLDSGAFPHLLSTDDVCCAGADLLHLNLSLSIAITWYCGGGYRSSSRNLVNWRVSNRFESFPLRYYGRTSSEVVVLESGSQQKRGQRKRKRSHRFSAESNGMGWYSKELKALYADCVSGFEWHWQYLLPPPIADRDEYACSSPAEWATVIPSGTLLNIYCWNVLRELLTIVWTCSRNYSDSDFNCDSNNAGYRGFVLSGFPWDSHYTFVDDVRKHVVELLISLGIKDLMDEEAGAGDNKVLIMVSPSYMGSCMYILSPTVCECRGLFGIVDTEQVDMPSGASGYTLMSGSVLRSGKGIVIQLDDLYLYDGTYPYPPNCTVFSNRYSVLKQFVYYGMHMRVLNDWIVLSNPMKAYLAVEGLLGLQIKECSF